MSTEFVLALKVVLLCPEFLDPTGQLSALLPLSGIEKTKLPDERL